MLRSLLGNNRFSERLQIAYIYTFFLHIPSFLQVFTIDSFIHPFFPLKTSDVFQISSHGISFSSDIILKTSHEILFLWEDSEKNS